MPKRVLIVDDSSFIREVLSSLLSDDPELEIVGTAIDAQDARQKIKTLNPDVITLDIEMPGMSGLQFLEQLMRLRPIPVVMISSRTQKGATDTVLALELGAVDFVAKPVDDPNGIGALASEILLKVKAAANAQVFGATEVPKPVPSPNAPSQQVLESKIIAIGASTGGVEAIRTVLAGLPSRSPPIIITQHMPANFTARFADRLNDISPFRVSEAKDGDILVPGHAYIAPGDLHLTLQSTGLKRSIQLDKREKVSGHRPSVDVMFGSLASRFAKNTIAVLLTGMGQDGAKSMLDLRNNGAVTIGQDKSSCVIYGMPGAAMKLGAVEHEVALPRISQKILEYFMK